MKKVLFALSAATMVFAMAACNNDPIEVAAQRPGAPRDVTIEPSPNGDWALVSWTAGGNTVNYQYEVVRRQNGAETILDLGNADAELFMNSLDLPDAEGNHGLRSSTSYNYNRTTLSWNPDSTLSWAPNNNIDKFQTVVGLVTDREPGEFQIGVRALYVFNQNLSDTAYSDVTWARDPNTFIAAVWSNTWDITSGDIIRPAGTEIDLNTAVTMRVTPENATMRSLRWEVSVVSPFNTNIQIPVSGGKFTPPYAGQYNVTAYLIGQDPSDNWVTKNLQIEVTGTPFIPVSSVSIPAAQGANFTINLAAATIIPADATNASNIRWEVQTSDASGHVGSWAPVTGTTWDIPATGSARLRVIIDNGRFWTNAGRWSSQTDFPHYNLSFSLNRGSDVFVTHLNFHGSAGLTLSTTDTSDTTAVPMSAQVGRTVNLTGVVALPADAAVRGPITWTRNNFIGSANGAEVPINGSFIPEATGNITLNAYIDGQFFDNWNVIVNPAP